MIYCSLLSLYKFLSREIDVHFHKQHLGRARIHTPCLLHLSNLPVTFSQVDILINNAGIVTGKTLLQCPDSSITKTFEVNTISHFWVSHLSDTRVAVMSFFVYSRGVVSCLIHLLEFEMCYSFICFTAKIWTIFILFYFVCRALLKFQEGSIEPHI